MGKVGGSLVFRRGGFYVSLLWSFVTRRMSDGRAKGREHSYTLPTCTEMLNDEYEQCVLSDNHSRPARYVHPSRARLGRAVQTLNQITAPELTVGAK
jgi:hypothetical protein